jgi:hypothetical protein
VDLSSDDIRDPAAKEASHCAAAVQNGFAPASWDRLLTMTRILGIHH